MKISRIIPAVIIVASLLDAKASDKLLLLGDMHLDCIENHDMEWLATKGDNLRQVTEEYTVWTRDNFPAFARTLRDVAGDCSAVVQLGDLSEGLAGNEDKAVDMARYAFAAIDSLHLNVPFVMTKGNHDITGPGAKEAFKSVYLPTMSRLSHRRDTLSSATYSTSVGDNILIVCYDTWDKRSTPALLDSLLRSSTARHKFVAVHEPVIPVNHRCWHVYRKDEAKRNDLLEVIARNKAVVLCAHLHKYSVVCRNTSCGPIVQILVNSVIRDHEQTAGGTVSHDYDLTMFEGREDWEPSTLQQRMMWIQSEMPDISYYSYADIPGYAILQIDGDDMVLNYYRGAATAPVDTVNISNLYIQ